MSEHHPGHTIFDEAEAWQNADQLERPCDPALVNPEGRYGRNIAAIQADAALINTQCTRNEIDHCGFARPIRPNNAHHLIALYIKG